MDEQIQAATMSWPIRMRSEYVTMSITSSRKREENKKYVAPPTGRDHPPTAAGSACVNLDIGMKRPISDTM